MNPETRHSAQAEMLANRIKKRFAHLHKRFARQNIEVFRLYDWDIPEIRAVVDWYAGHLVVGEYTRTQSTAEWLPRMAEAAAQALSVPEDKVHLKLRYSGKAGGKRYSRIDYTDKMIVVRERDLQFHVNPWDYVDTGLFADHRDTRRMVRQKAAGRDFLNLFCYTGTFTCYAAKGGARTTASVDRSKTAIAWTRKNLSLNEITGTAHQLFQADAMDYLARARRENRRYDLAVVDPPSFSTTRSREDHFDIAADHPMLLNAVQAVMREGGTIFFSTNHQNFTLRPNELQAGRIEEITSRTIPEDYQHKRKSIHRCWLLGV